MFTFIMLAASSPSPWWVTSIVWPIFWLLLRSSLLVVGGFLSLRRMLVRLGSLGFVGLKRLGGLFLRLMLLVFGGRLLFFLLVCSLQDVLGRLQPCSCPCLFWRLCKPFGLWGFHRPLGLHPYSFQPQPPLALDSAFNVFQQIFADFNSSKPFLKLANFALNFLFSLL